MADELTATKGSEQQGLYLPAALLVVAILFASLIFRPGIINYPMMVDVAVITFASFLAMQTRHLLSLDPERKNAEFLLSTAFLVLGAALTLAATDGFVSRANGEIIRANANIIFGVAVILFAIIVRRKLASGQDFSPWLDYVFALAVYTIHRVVSSYWHALPEFTRITDLLVTLGTTLFVVIVAGFAMQLGQRDRSSAEALHRSRIALFLLSIAVLLAFSFLFFTGNSDESSASGFCTNAETSPENYCARIHFATTRSIQRSEKAGFGERFSNRLRLGVQDVQLSLKPMSREIGNDQTQEPVFNRQKAFRNKSELPSNVATQLFDFGGKKSPASNKREFIDSLEKELSRSDNTVLFYIHGFNQSFETAIDNAAQLAFDITAADGEPLESKLKPQIQYRVGTPVIFSWPTQSWIADDDSVALFDKLQIYLDDKNRANQSSGQLAQFLDLLVDETNVKKINIVIHSMGNRLFMESIDEIESAIGDAIEEKDIAFSIIHAASEYDRELYRDKISAIRSRAPDFYARMFSDVSIYSSSTDDALLLGETVKKYWDDWELFEQLKCSVGRWSPDAERAACQHPFIMSGDHAAQFSTIDASGFVLTQTEDESHTDFGHGYYLNAPAVLADVGCALDGIPAGDQRRPLTKIPVGSAPSAGDSLYFQFDPNAGTAPQCRVVEWEERLSVEPQNTCDTPTENFVWSDDRLIVYFGLNKSVLDEQQIAQVRNFAERAGGRQMFVQGFTDQSGDACHNAALVEEREKSVLSAIAARPQVAVSERNIEEDQNTCGGAIDESLRCERERRAELYYRAEQK